MKQQIKKWTFRFTITGLLLLGLLLLIVINPGLTYANKTIHNNFTIFHNQALTQALLAKLDQATELLKTSEWYNPASKFDICLNDGSFYPKLMQAIRGQAFAWGFYDKVIMQGTANYNENYVALKGYKWDLT